MSVPTPAPMPTPMQMVCLHCRQGTSNKFYVIWIEQHGDGGHVMVGYGRATADKAIIAHHSGPHLGIAQARHSALDLVIAKERKGYLDVLSSAYNSTSLTPPVNVFRLMCMKVMPTRGRLVDVNTDPGPVQADPSQTQQEFAQAITAARGGDAGKYTPAPAKSKPTILHVTRSGRSLE